MGNGTVEDIVAGIRFHYGNGYNMLADSTAYEPGENLKKEETIAMEIKDFATKVSTEVKKELGTGYEVGLKEVRKNNGIIRYGLAIMPQGQDVKAETIIYMEEFLEAHVSGMPFREVVRKVVGAYRQNMPEDCADIRSFHIFEKVRDRICFRLIGRKGNEELLEDVPHADFLDLAVCLYYACQEEGLGGGIIPIRNSHVEMWGTKKNELFSLAGRNTPRLFPWTCSSMDEVIAEALSFERADGGEDGWPEDGMPMPGTQMKVLSNVKWVHGAACMLYPGVLEALAQEEGCGFYILPSSVNEVLLLPDTDETLAADELKQMVMDVNRTQVAPEEVLSDSLYRYDAVRKEVMKI